MIWLWIAAAVISAGAASLMVARAARAARIGAGENPSLAIYRRQMAEIDDLADRGLLAEDDRRGARTETGRRLLAAAERREPAGRAAGPLALLIVAAVAPVVAFGLYLLVGSPGQLDQPFAKRLASWRAADPESLDPARMAAILRAIAAERPTDPEPLRHLAVAELAAGQPTEAVQALRRATIIAPNRADVWETLGEIQVLQAQGDVGAEAKDAFARALTLDPKSPTARYYLGRAQVAEGDAAGGLARWRALAADLAPGDPRLPGLMQDIDAVAKTGQLPPVAPEPSATPNGGGPDIQAMVDGLAARLKANPDDPQGWVRLVRAYTVLGETDRRDAALAVARKRYAGHADIMAALDDALKPPS